MPGFGHPLHQPVDPRAERILALADGETASPAATSISPAASYPRSPTVWGRPLPMNVSMPIAACLLDLDFPAAMIKGDPDPRPHRAGSSPISPRSRSGRSASSWPRQGEEAIAYDGSAERMMVDPEIETRPWGEQAAADDPLYRRQIAYLFANSRFYRDKLVRAGFASPDKVGGLDGNRRAAVHREGRAPRRRGATPTRSAPISPRR